MERHGYLIMNHNQSSAELKAISKEQLFGNYGTLIGAEILMSLMTTVLTLLAFFITDTSTIIGYSIYYLILFVITLLSGLFTSGLCYLYLKVICRQPVLVSDIFYGFRFNPDKALLIQFRKTGLIFLANIPALVLGNLYGRTLSPALFLCYCISILFALTVFAVVSLMFAPCFYLLHDFPEYSAKKLVQMSFELMKGQKGRLFYIAASFLPLFFLSILSCCIANLWISPYMNTTYANFYMDLIRKKGRS